MADLTIVAEKLQAIACASKEDDAIDAFGRSAFNRYYYSAFLTVRATLTEMNSSWAKMAHKNMPDLLTGEVWTRIHREAQKQTATAFISRKEAKEELHAANTAVAELASLLNLSRAVRVTADYEPDTRAMRCAAGVSLASCTLDAAKRWPHTAERFSKQLLRVWRHLGI